MNDDDEVIMLTKRYLIVALACFPFLPKIAFTGTTKQTPIKTTITKPKSGVSKSPLKANSKSQISTKDTNKKPKSFKLTFDKTTNTWTTPAGLKYGQGSMQGNYIKHVLEYAVSNPNKTTHPAVFNVSRKKVLELVDEAWLAKGSPLPNDPGVYIVSVKRVIGTAGETKIKISVRPGTNEIVTVNPIP